MSLDDWIVAAFAVFNLGRGLAYVPQIIRVCQDRDGATAVSALTWSLFTGANVTTSAYAAVHMSDLVVAGVFAFNACGCITIVVVTLAKRGTWGKLRARDFVGKARTQTRRFSVTSLAPTAAMGLDRP